MWFFLSACTSPSTNPGTGTYVDTSVASPPTPTHADTGMVTVDTLTYDNTGVACLSTDSHGRSQIWVDFGPCPAGVYSGDLTCSATVDGDRIAVEAGGTVTVYSRPLDTCGGIDAFCAVDLADGDWTLSYAGVDAAVTTPTDDWVCTGVR